MLQAACNTGVRGKICHEKTENSNFISGLAFPVFRSNIEAFDFALDKQSPLGQVRSESFMDTSIGQLRKSPPHCHSTTIARSILISALLDLRIHRLVDDVSSGAFSYSAPGLSVLLNGRLTSVSHTCAGRAT
jgi:hypothetical protein